MASNAFPVTTAQIVSLFTECILYGIYLITLTQCLWALLCSDSERTIEPKIRWRLLVVAILLCIFATLDVACGLRFNIVALVYYTGPGGSAALFVDYWINRVKSLNFVMQTWIGGALLIYRCYLVYERNWKIIIPAFVMWLASIACGIVGGIESFKSSAALYERQVQSYITSMLSLSFGMNIITASLMVYRMWTIDKQMAKRINVSPTSLRLLRYRQILQIIVESAALYTLAILFLAGTYMSESNAYIVVADSIVQIIGICINLIIIRICSERSFDVIIKGSSTLPGIDLKLLKSTTNKPANIQSHDIVRL